jgi:proteasome lid subunit RPN8/RPN11
MFSRAILDAIKAHAAATPEVEVCGIVTADGYEQHENLHETPETHFRMSDAVAERVALGEVLAIVHSHTNHGLDHPSIEDQRQALAMGIPWGLVVIRHGVVQEPFFWGEGVAPLPVMPRDFRWGPEGTDGRGDCLALVRAWYRDHRGLIIPDTPRDKTWEEEIPEAYVEGWQREGFRRIGEDQLRPGDALLFSLQSSKWLPNHAAIYLGDEMILHHLAGRLAERGPFSFARRSLVMCLRPPERAA